MADYDVIIIGGGINGAGIARDAAWRGLKVCLLEQGDLCNATTRWSSRLIHGGLRYLEHAEFGLVWESLRERGTLLRIAPHLVQPLPMLIPIYRGARRGRRLIGAGMWLYDLLSPGGAQPRHRMLSVAETLERLPQLSPEALVGAAAYRDAQVAFPERLVVENVLAARRAGADIRTWTRVDRILVENRVVTGVAATELRDGRQATLAAPLVVNATGPWVDLVLEHSAIGLQERSAAALLIGGSRGSHIVVDAFAGRPETACYAEAGADGRPFFVIPWNGLTLIGTTDIPCDGDPGAARPDGDEIAYLLAETNRLVPAAALTRESIHYMYAGVRPLPRTTGRKQSAITRRHHIRHHRDVARGLYSVLGGKLTTYRHLAEQVVDRLAARIGRDLRGCTTAHRPLPGAAANAAEVHQALYSGTALRPAAIARLVGLYGCRAADVAELARRHPELAAEICPATHAIAAEVVFAFEAEMAMTLADCLMRRTMLGLGSDLGLAVLPSALEVARRQLGWNAVRVEEERRQMLMETDALRPPSVAAAGKCHARSSAG